MHIRSILAAAFILAGATVIAFAAMQLHGAAPRIAEAGHAVNENSINRLPIPPDLPVVMVEEAW